MGIEGMYFHMIKVTYDKPRDNITLNKNLEMFP